MNTGQKINYTNVFKMTKLSILYLYIYIIPYYRAKNDSVTIG